jgi:AI-2 transport system permease protein
MSSISYLLVFMGFSSDYNDAITGTILIVIVVTDSVMQIRSRRKLRHERLQARTRNDMSVGEGDAA